MNRKTAYCLSFLVLMFCSVTYANEPDFPLPWNWTVSSDFGPRKVGGWDFHEGIDFNKSPGDGDFGTPIPAVEGGTIRAIATRNKFYNIDVDGTSDRWLYGHIFGNTQHKYGQWELIFNALLVNPSDPLDQQQKNIIIQWSNSQSTTTAIKVLSDLNGRFVKFTSTGSYISGTNGTPITTRSTVSQGEDIAIMGNAGTDNTHLHLGLNYPDDNPFFHLIHSGNNQVSAIILNPTEGQTIESEELSLPISFKAQVLSSGNLDLDKINMWVELNGDSLNKNFLQSDTASTFQFGGNVSGNKSNTMVESNGSTTGTILDINNTGQSLGDDTFIFSKDISDLPGGNHRFVMSCLDVNDHEGCPNTYVTFKIIKCDPAQPDTAPPEISLFSPVECVTAPGSQSVCGEVRDSCSNPENLTLNGVPVEFTSLDPVSHSAQFCTDIVLSEGSNPLLFQVHDSSGNIGTLTTGINVDNTSPALLQTVPADGAVNVPFNSALQASFDEPLSEGVIVVEGGPVSGVTTSSGTLLSFLHSGLLPDTSYVLNTHNVFDTCGNEGSSAASRFTTGAFFARIKSPNNSTTWQTLASLEVTGEITNPLSIATVTVTVSFAGSPQQQTVLVGPSSLSNWSLNFQLPAQEGPLSILIDRALSRAHRPGQ